MREKTYSFTIEEIPIIVTKKRMKNMYLRISKEDGSVRISAPHQMSDERIYRFAKERIDWIRVYREKYLRAKEGRREVRQLSEAELKQVLQKFLGKQMQLPPMYSAIKVNGQKLYQLARKGVEVERQARPIEIYKLELLSAALPAEQIELAELDKYKFTVAVECSKGTYIRVLGEDIAAALGTCGTMSFLLRTQVGSYLLENAHTLQEIAANPVAYCAELLTAVEHLPKLVLNARQAARITNGVRTTIAGTLAGQYVLLGPQQEFLGIGKCQDEKVQAEKIFAHYQMSAEE